MNRIKIKYSGNYNFKTEIDVQIGDINYGGHLSNDAIMRLAHEARLQFLASYGYSELNTEDLGLIMIDAGIEFKSEAFHGDKLQIELAVDEITNLGFDIYYKFTNQKTHKLVALVKTGMVFFNYESHKKEATPENFRNKVSL